MPQIEILFPENINTFIDLFSGGCDVGINALSNYVIFNDIQKELIDLFLYFKSSNYEEILSEITKIIDKYNLSKTSEYGYEHYGSNSNKGVGLYNKNNYLKLRDDYNDGMREPIFFYTMVLYSFNNMIRFNKDNKFNVAVNKRDFNNNLKKKLKVFVDKLNTTPCTFTSVDFRDYAAYNFKVNDFVYCDPPYMISTANYNESGGWTEQDEIDLLSFLDVLHEKNIKFALSNVLESKGKSNDMLKEWSKSYNVHYLNKSYSNSNYQRKDTKTKDIEVLITNY